MKARDYPVDVHVWDDEPTTLFGRWFEPDAPDDSLPVLVCIPGGTYDHHYWDLDIPGERYSFAAEMTDRGYTVVAFDNLGTGASSRPSRPAGIAELGTALASAVDAIRHEAPEAARVVGVGHSMGGYILVTQQASAHSCDAIAVLGTTIGPSTIVPVPDDVLESARRGHDARVALADATEPRISGDQVPTSRAAPGLELFHLGDVPQPVLDADISQAATVLPVRTAAEASVAWFAADAAASIDVPVFLAFGEVDVAPVPSNEPGAYPRSPDVTLFTLAGSAHCHNMATTRMVLWDRLDRWVRSL